MTDGHDLPRHDDDGSSRRRPGPVPVLAVVGRPNVGKSTLVNRIIGRREAVVEDVPGVTRDRVSYDANWNGRAFTVVDTGGWDPDARGLAERIARPGRDRGRPGRRGAVRRRRDRRDHRRRRGRREDPARVGKPVVLAANKVDDQRTEAEAYGLWNLGLGEPYPVSGAARPRLGRHARRRPRRAARAAAGARRPRSAARAGSRSSASPTSASPRCSTSWPARTGSSSTTSPAPPSTRSTS